MIRTSNSLRVKEVHFRFFTEQFDSDTDHGRFTLQMYGAMAEYFLDLNRERTMDGLKAALA
jgi:DNA invertase Pin-like site-specific DNA recombinase